jgi:hypothetical protein
MTRPLDLPEPIFDALSQAAEECGTTPVGWIVAHLPSSETSKSGSAATLADLFVGRTGNISSGNASNLSENCTERFTDELERKRIEGRL